MDTDRFIFYLETEDIYIDTTKNAETIFDTLNNELQRLLPRGKSKKLIGSMKDELGQKVMTEFAALRPRTYSYLTDDYDENRKTKTQKTVP